MRTELNKYSDTNKIEERADTDMVEKLIEELEKDKESKPSVNAKADKPMKVKVQIKRSSMKSDASNNKKVSSTNCKVFKTCRGGEEMAMDLVAEDEREGSLLSGDEPAAIQSSCKIQGEVFHMVAFK